MTRRYLYGPVRQEWIEAHLPAACREGTCVPFTSTDTWQSACARMPAGTTPEFIAIYLAYSAVPDWVWRAAVPLVGMAADWNLQFHHYRRCVRRCDLLLTDAPGVEVFARAGIAHARAANLYGPDAQWLALPAWQDSRPIDVLFIGNLHPATQRERLGWLGRIARLADRWKVRIATNTFGAEYRHLHNLARIVVNRSVRGECNQRVFEAMLSGALLLQEADNREVPALFADRRECVLYRDDNLESFLDHYLTHEEERSVIAEAGRQKALTCGYETLWGQALSLIDAEWEAIAERAAQRVARPAMPDPIDRVWEGLGTHGPLSPQLVPEVEAALAANRNSPSLHNAMGLAVALAQGHGRAGSSTSAEIVAGHFLEALKCNPAHVVAGLNLAEALIAFQQKAAALETGRRTLAALAADTNASPTWLDDGHLATGFDVFRVEWERCAWKHAGHPAAEAQAKRELVRWRLHTLLAQLTGDLSHYHEAALARPDLPQTRGELGCALAQVRRFAEAVPHLRLAVDGNPFDRIGARALFQALTDAGEQAGAQRFAHEQRLFAKAAPGVVPQEPWFASTAPLGNELASLIILCCNEVEVSRLCLESVLTHTRAPYELILVDNGSTDGTPALLDEMKKRSGPARVMVIRNETNVGFPAGCNQGLREAHGEYVVLLNNDTVVTPGWLDGLVRWAAHEWPTVGLVGPMTNYASSPQVVEPGYSENLGGLNAFAAQRCQQFRSKALEVPRLTGFCLLVRRAVLDRIGGFDEQFGVGFFDDDDLCIRARRAGFRLLVAQDVFIHHFGSRTFKALGVNTEQQLHDNLARFAAKWGAEEASHYRAPGKANGEVPMSLQVVPSPTVVVPAGVATARARVSCCIITKNEEKNIADCLRCVIDLVDEVIVQDTGSTDSTREIARSMGARVFEFPWVDSFSAARNESIKHATGEWIFWVDADDRIDEENREKLRALFAGLGQENRAFVLKCFCVPDMASATGTTVTHVRLFRRMDCIRFEHRVHEQAWSSAKASGAQLVYADVVIRHVGYVDREVRRKKLDRDLRLLRLEEAEQPDHPFTLFNLGMTLLEVGQHTAAMSYLRRSLAASHPNDSIVRKLYALMAECLWKMGEVRAALATCAEGRGHYPDDEELLWLQGRLCEEVQDLAGAETAYLRLVNGNEGDHLGSTRGSLRSVCGRDRLAHLYFGQGRLAEAEALWRQVVFVDLKYLHAWEGLADVAMREGRWADAEQALMRLVELDPGHAAARSNLEAMRRQLGR
jgi:GT2 family glycosyltransferase/Tfp pilus assembly protein PilF